MPTRITAKLVDKLSPIDALPRASRLALLKTARGARLGAEKSIKDWQFKEDLLYLLEGALHDEQSNYSHPAVSEQARAEPLFTEHSYDVTLFADSDCQLIRFDRSLYRSLLEKEERLTTEKDVEVDVGESSLVHEVFIACSMGAIELPQMPRVALRVRALCANEKTSTADLTAVLQTDAVLAGRMVHAANSVLYRGQTRIDHVKDAVIRMGFDTVNQMALGLAMKKEYRARSRLIRHHLDDFWHESAQVSAIVYVLAADFSSLDQDMALFVGLLHNIGVLPVLLHLDTYEKSLTGPEVDQVVKKVAPTTGQMVADSWGLADSVQLAVNECMDWMREHDGGPDYCDLVIAARWISLAIDAVPEGLPEIVDVPAFAKLQISDPREFLEKAKDQIIELQVVLSG